MADPTEDGKSATGDRGRARNSRDPRFPTDYLQITPWADPVIDQLGHDPRSSYVERFWLGILGPSTTWLLRSLAHRLDHQPDGFTLDLPEIARTLGLGTKGGQQSPFIRALGRSCQFGLALPLDATSLAVRRRLPPLTRRQVERLPSSLQEAHTTWSERGVPAGTPTDLRTRAKRLALTLIDLGEDFDTTERQLHRWRFHPAMAHEATTWAWDHRHKPPRPLSAATRPAPETAPTPGHDAEPVADLSGDAA